MLIFFVKSMFDILESDIVVFQETKIQRKDLRDDMVLVPGWDCYFSLPRVKKGEDPTPKQLTMTFFNQFQATLAWLSIHETRRVHLLGLKKASQESSTRLIHQCLSVTCHQTNR